MTLLKGTKLYWAVVRRHEAGLHSDKCPTYDIDYCGYVCYYTLETYPLPTDEERADAFNMRELYR